MGFNFGSYKPNSMDGTSELVKTEKLKTLYMQNDNSNNLR